MLRPSTEKGEETRLRVLNSQKAHHLTFTIGEKFLEANDRVMFERFAR
jgi:hypothetical protein